MLNNLLGKCMSRKVFPRIAVKMFHIPRVRLVRLAWWLHVFGCRSYSERRGDHGHGAQVVTLEKVGAVAASINTTTTQTPDTITLADSCLLTASASAQYTQTLIKNYI